MGGSHSAASQINNSINLPWRLDMWRRIYCTGTG